MDIDKLYRLVLKGNTQEEIATLMETTQENVSYHIEKYLPHLKDLDLYKEYKTDIIQGLQSRTVGLLLKKAEHASPKDLIALLSATQEIISPKKGDVNIGVAISIEDIVSKKEKIISNLRKDGVNEAEIESHFAAHVAIPYDSTLPVSEVAEAANNRKCKIIQKTLF